MDALGLAGDLIQLVWTILSFVIVLSVVVAIHELGHLMVGRWCGIKAEVYSIGFGKVLWARTDRYGTRWQVALLPFGGFVKFLGDMDPASTRRVADEEIAPDERRHAFHNAALWRRALTVVAGPVANFLLSILIFFGLGLALEWPTEDPVVAGIEPDRPGIVGFEAGDRVLALGETDIPDFATLMSELLKTNGAETRAVIERDGREIETQVRYVSPPRVTALTADGAAIAAGMRLGDLIVDIGGNEISSSRQLALVAATLSVDETVSVIVDREGKRIALDFAPRFVTRTHPVTGEVEPVPTLGVSLGDLGIRPLVTSGTVGDAAWYGVFSVWKIIRDTILYIEQMLFKGADTSSLSGPIGIAKHSATAASAGWMTYIHFIAFVSTAIGLLNLFPIPVLDGGHLLFYATEAIRGKPTNGTVVKYGTMAGLSLLLLLMVFVTFNNDLGLGEWLSQNQGG
ncbi:MAG: RIP metalloprotease RseP [Pseudomonadota bacterium]